jgi:hypothetical protein
LLFVFATLAVVVNPFGSARFIFGGVWLSLLAQKKIATTVRARRLFSFAIVVGFVFVFPIADRFSRPGAGGKRFRAPEVFQGNGDYDAFAQTNNSLKIVAHSGLSYGRQLVGVFFSAPLVSELYVNGGMLLVIFGFALIGIAFTRSLDTTSARSAAGCIVVCTVPFYLPILLRGSLLQATGFAALFALCVLVLRLTAHPSDPASAQAILFRRSLSTGGGQWSARRC